MPYSVPAKDSIYGAVEALRASLASWTGERWIYANQDLNEDWPLGVIQAISSAPQGRPWSVIDADKEVAYTNIRVIAQASFIEKAARGPDAERGMFRASSVLSSVRQAIALEGFKVLFLSASKLRSVTCSIVGAGEVRPEIQALEVGLFVPASLDIELDVWSKTQPDDPAPCVARGQAPDVNVTIRH